MAIKVPDEEKEAPESFLFKVDTSVGSYIIYWKALMIPVHWHV